MRAALSTPPPTQARLAGARLPRRTASCRRNAPPPTRAPVWGQPPGPGRRGRGVKAAALPEEELLARAKEILDSGEQGFYKPINPDLFDQENFVFRGPVVGPLNFRDYIRTLDENRIAACWGMDIQSNHWGFSVDPNDELENRVWFFVRNTGLHTGTLRLGPLSVDATGKEIRGSPEAASLVLNDEGRLKMLTIGYVADYDYPNTTSEREGAFYGILNSIGARWMVPPPAVFKRVMAFERARGNFPVASVRDSARFNYSNPEDLPQWYRKYLQTDEVRLGQEGLPGV